MKDAKIYEKRLKKLLKSVSGGKAKHEEADGIAVLIEAVLSADATKADTAGAIAAISEEFVDYNELRVAQPKELSECIGKDFPNARGKAVMLTTALNGIFDRRYQMSVEYMAKMTKRDLRRHLAELGLDTYAGAYMALKVFDGHAIPLDQSLADYLEMNECIHPGSSMEDVQGFLERVIPHKNAMAAHEYFRNTIAHSSKSLEKYRQEKAEAAEAERRRIEEEERKKQEEVERKAREAEERKKARAAKKKAREKAAKKKSKKAAAKSKKSKKSKKAKKAKKVSKKEKK